MPDRRKPTNQEAVAGGVAAAGAGGYLAHRQSLGGAGYVNEATRRGQIQRGSAYFGNAHPSVKRIANMKGTRNQKITALMKDKEAQRHLHRDLGSRTPSREALHVSYLIHPRASTNPSIAHARKKGRAKYVMHDPLNRSRDLRRHVTREMINSSNPEHTPHLYRGVRGIEHNVGDTVDMGEYSSFTSSRPIAEVFAHQRGARKPAVYHIKGGTTKAFPLDGTGGRSHNHEWLAGGKFKVTKKVAVPHPTNPGAVVHHYHLEPIASHLAKRMTRTQQEGATLGVASGAAGGSLGLAVRSARKTGAARAYTNLRDYADRSADASELNAHRMARTAQAARQNGDKALIGSSRRIRGQELHASTKVRAVGDRGESLRLAAVKSSRRSKAGAAVLAATAAGAAYQHKKIQKGENYVAVVATGDSADHRPDRPGDPALVSKLTDRQLRRRMKVQGNLSAATATIGLTALGMKGGGAAAKKFIKPASKGARIGERMERHTTGALTLGAGLGGIAGFNSAAIAREQAKHRQIPSGNQQQHIHKDWTDFDRRRKVDPAVRQYGLRKPLPDDLSREERLRVWQARDKHLNRKRDQWDRRAKGAQGVQVAAETATGAVGATLGARTLRDAYKREHPKKFANFVEHSGPAVRRAATAKTSFRFLAAGAAAGATAAGARQAVRISEHERKKYSSREGGTASAAVQRMKKSAFGVDHALPLV